MPTGRRGSPSRSASSSTAVRSPPPTNAASAIVDVSFYIMFNAHHEPLQFKLPPRAFGTSWTQVLDTAGPDDEMSEERLGRPFKAGAVITVDAWSVRLLRRLK